MKTCLRLEALEGRETPSATVGDPAEAYSWMLVNEMRRDPAGFAEQLDGLRRGTVDSAFGFSKSDPVVRDFRRLLGYSRWPGHYKQALGFLRSAEAVGPLGWDDVLTDRANRHADGMRTHSFEHTAQDHPRKWYIPGFRTGYRGGDPDNWGYDPGRYSWWGENIGYTYGLMANSKAAYSAHRIGQIGFHQRAAFIDTISYMLEVNSPDMAHLEQLLRSDSAPDGGSPHFNVIGMDVDFFEGPYESRDGLGEATLSTHRLGLYRPNSGGFLTGIAFRDGNGNDYFDAGEGLGGTIAVVGPASFTDSLDRLGSHGVYSRYLPNGAYSVTATASDGTLLGASTVFINNANAWFEFRDDRMSSAAVPELQVDGPEGSVGVRPTFSWNTAPEAIGYEIRLADRSSGRSNLFPFTRTPADTWSPPADLIPGRSYRVLVRAILPYADSGWSALDFRVATPTPIGPVGDITTTRPAFTWSAVDGASTYAIVVDDLTTGRRSLFRESTKTTSWVPPADLTVGHAYRWRVAALNAAGLGRWSQWHTVRVVIE
jgi:hypothetical protein